MNYLEDLYERRNQMNYLEDLYENFKDIQFSLVHFANGCTPQSMQCYLLARNLSKEHLKNKGTLALDLGNYIYRRFGFSYEISPEFHRAEEPKNSVAFYQSQENFQAAPNAHIRDWILAHNPGATRAKSVLYEKGSLIIPHIPLFIDYGALWKKTGEFVILREGQFTTIIFEVAGKEFRYPQAELGPESDFKILGVL